MSPGFIEAAKQYIIGYIVPLVASFLATWLGSTEVLAIFNITQNAAAAEITKGLVFLVSLAVTAFLGHNINKGTFSPAAKAARGRLGQ